MGTARDAPAKCKLCKRDGVDALVKRNQGSTRDLWAHLRRTHGFDKLGQ